MEEFYPSEVARLVLGYLKEINCTKAWDSFLKECPDLDEHCRLFSEGKFCTTNVHGKSLLDILKEYCALKRDAIINNNSNGFTKTVNINEVFKTPNKANENAFARFRINQKVQSQSAASSNINRISSPSSRNNLFRTPPSKASKPTPRRRLDTQATPLNFGSQAESANLSNPEIHLHDLFKASSRTPSCHKNAATDNCYSDSALIIKSKCISKNVQNNLDAKSKNPDVIHKERNLIPSRASGSSKSNSRTTISEHIHTSELPNEETGPSNDTSSLVYKDKILATLDYSDLMQLEDTASISGDHSLHTEQNPDEHCSVLNKRLVYKSSEITANGTNITMTTLESCYTPQTTPDPPSYHRAPLTNSPRIILSYDRSQIPSLTTPIKDSRYWNDEECSPKRKGLFPRKKLLLESPSGKHMQQNENLDPLFEYMFDDVNEHNPFVQLLADNINFNMNKVQSELQKEHAEEQDVDVEDIVKTTTTGIIEDLVSWKNIAIGNRDESDSHELPSVSKTNDTNGVPFESESVSENITKKNNLQKDTNHFQNEETSQSVPVAGNSDILENAFQATFGEMCNPPELATSVYSSNQTVVEKDHNNLKASDKVCETDKSKCTDCVKASSSNNEDKNKTDVSETECAKSCDILTHNATHKDSTTDNLCLTHPVQTVIDSTSLNSTNIISTTNDLDNQNYETDGAKDAQKTDPNNSVLTQSNVSSESNQGSTTAPQPVNSSTCLEFTTTSASQVVSSSTTLDLTAASAPQPVCSSITLDTSNNNQFVNAFISPQISNQPLMPLTVPYYAVMQNGMYRIFINSPVTYTPAPVGGMCAPVSSIPAMDLSNQVIFNPAPAPAPVTTLTNIDNLEVVSCDNNLGNTVNFVTAATGNQISPFVNSQVPLNISDTSQVKSPSKKNQRSTKRKKTVKEDSPKERANKDVSGSPLAKKKKRGTKRGKKRKLLRLFPSSPEPINIVETPDKSMENVPVLSIPDSPSLGQSSAFKIMSKITGQFEREERSPVLKVLMSNAAVLTSPTDSRLNTSHVRCLDFGAKPSDVIDADQNKRKSPEINKKTSTEKGKKNCTENGKKNSTENKTKAKSIYKSPIENNTQQHSSTTRRSLRIQQKGKQNQDSLQEQNDKFSSSNPHAPKNKRKKSLPKKNTQISENSLTYIVLQTMEEANTKKSKTENFNNVSSYSLPFMDAISLPNASQCISDENVRNQIAGPIDTDLEKNEGIVNSNLSNISVSKLNVNKSDTSLVEVQEQSIENSSTANVDSIVKSKDSVPENIGEKEKANETSLKLSTSNIDKHNNDSYIEKNSQVVDSSEQSSKMLTHLGNITINLNCNKSVNVTGNNKEDSENKVKVSKNLNTEVKELMNSIFGSDCSSDENSDKDCSVKVHKAPSNEISTNIVSVTEIENQTISHSAENSNNSSFRSVSTSDEISESEPNTLISPVKSLLQKEEKNDAVFKKDPIPCNVNKTEFKDVNKNVTPATKGSVKLKIASDSTDCSLSVNLKESQMNFLTLVKDSKTQLQMSDEKKSQGRSKDLDILPEKCFHKKTPEKTNVIHEGGEIISESNSDNITQKLSREEKSSDSLEGEWKLIPVSPVCDRNAYSYRKAYMSRHYYSRSGSKSRDHHKSYYTKSSRHREKSQYSTHRNFRSPERLESHNRVWHSRKYDIYNRQSNKHHTYRSTQNEYTKDSKGYNSTYSRSHTSNISDEYHKKDESNRSSNLCKSGKLEKPFKSNSSIKETVLPNANKTDKKFKESTSNPTVDHLEPSKLQKSKENSGSSKTLATFPSSSFKIPKKKSINCNTNVSGTITVLSQKCGKKSNDLSQTKSIKSSSIKYAGKLNTSSVSKENNQKSLPGPEKFGKESHVLSQTKSPKSSNIQNAEKLSTSSVSKETSQKSVPGPEKFGKESCVLSQTKSPKSSNIQNAEKLSTSSVSKETSQKSVPGPKKFGKESRVLSQTKSPKSSNIKNAEKLSTSSVSKETSQKSVPGPQFPAHKDIPVPSVKSCAIVERNKLPHIEDSFSNASSKDSYLGTNRIPPKKRIRPIPVDTRSSPVVPPVFSPFLPEQTVVSAKGPASTGEGNSTVQGLLEKKEYISTKNLLEMDGTENPCESRRESVPISEPFSESMSLDTGDFNAKLCTYLSNLPGPVTPLKDAPISIPIFKSPQSKSLISNPTTPSPTIKSNFRTPYPLSGKPKSMERFYRRSFPDKKSELPISPLSFSNSSSTADGSSAKRQLLTDEPSAAQTGSQTNEDVHKSKDVEPKKNDCPIKDKSKDVELEKNDCQIKDKGLGKSVFKQKKNPVKKLSKDKKCLVSGNKKNPQDKSKVTEPVKEKNLTLSSNKNRKRKMSDSCYSDTCSTVVDYSDLEVIETPEKNDFLNKAVFSYEHSPVISKKKRLDEYDCSSEVTPTSSPEKEEKLDNHVNQTVSNALPDKNACKSSAKVSSSSNPRSLQKIHTESNAQNLAVKKPKINSKKVEQYEESVLNTNENVNSTMDKNLEQRAGEENDIDERKKLEMLLSKVMKLGLDKALDRLTS